MESETTVTSAQQVKEAALDLEMSAEPGPSTGVWPTMSLSLLPMGGEPNIGARSSSAASLLPMVAADHQPGECEGLMPSMVEKWISEAMQCGFEAGVHHNRYTTSRAEAPLSGRLHQFQDTRV